jgi:class 3 adenylate cyclase/pimeloyl-ACP methyl ester carboxylesterase
MRERRMVCTSHTRCSVTVRSTWSTFRRLSRTSSCNGKILSRPRYLRRLASFSRLIMFDKRGTGLSDRVGVATLEQRMDDLRAVMDAVNARQVAVFGSSEGGALSVLLSATYPDRVSALVLYGAYARLAYAPDYPVGLPKEMVDALLEHIESHWGQVGGGLPQFLLHPGRAGDPEYQQAVARSERLSASPGAAVAVLRMIFEIDVRHVLSALRVPTLILYRADEATHSPGSRYLAEHIPGARAVELPGDIYFPYYGDQDAIVDEIEEFLTGVRSHPEPDRVLATVLFTDIVGSTQLAADVGDRRWRELLARHEDVSRKEIQRQRGRFIKSTGDGVLATFDGPARAVKCACAIRDGLRAQDIEIRAGLHTGEIELIGDDIAGIAVHVGQRVSALAQPGEILASSTVVDLVSGSGLHFQDRGEHLFKGIPRPWRVFSAGE